VIFIQLLTALAVMMTSSREIWPCHDVTYFVEEFVHSLSVLSIVTLSI